MNSNDIQINDELFIKKEFCGRRIKVKIVDKRPGKCDGGFLFFTIPIVGSGTGLASFWFER